MSKKVFISYRRTDSQAEARSIYVRLREHFGGEDVFFDTSGIGKGVNFVERLNDELAGTGAILVIIGPTWTSAADESGNRRLDQPEDYVRVELETALAKKIPIFPAFVSDARVPAVSDLPPSLRSLMAFNGTTVTHSNFESDMAALIAALELRVGRPPLLSRLGRSALDGLSSFNRGPLLFRLPIFALLLLAFIQVASPTAISNAVAYTGALVRVSANPGRIPLSASSAADLDQILTSTEDQWCDSAGTPDDIWLSAQSYAACGAPPALFDQFDALVHQTFNQRCVCWKFENKQLAILFFWILEGYSKNRRQIDAPVIERLLNEQRAPGFWPTQLEGGQIDEKEPLYITALIVLALAHQEPFVSDPELKSEVNRAIRRGAAWLVQSEPAHAEDWVDYANNHSAIRHRLFGGMAVSAIAPVLSEEQTAAVARRWAQDLTFDQASLFLSSDVRHAFANGVSFGDTYRHVPLTWETCGLVAAWPSLSLSTRATLLVRLEARLRATADDAQAFERGWMQVDATYCLRTVKAATTQAA